ncbi:mitotic checkpoint regulator, MAD2B-interacting-domain-containing protein [Geopyxis carbonaria]|nr:mitotic checkpoint regulator, MAD2B-interacting-domain-containing protein [Geopyxis carbonaria]
MLVDYSDSDASDTEVQNTNAAPAPVRTSPPKNTGSLAALLPKPKGRKNKDASAVDQGPKKIIVNLPKISDEEFNQPPTKKARIGGGGGSGLSAMLPAPKRSSAAKANPVAPPVPSSSKAPESGIKDETKMEGIKSTEDKEGPNEKSKSKATNTTFVPQSVARKPIQPMSAFRKKAAATATSSVGIMNKVPAKPKVSLFGSAPIITGSNRRPKAPKAVTAREYKPIMLESTKPASRPLDDTDVFGEAGLDDSSTLESKNTDASEVRPANDLDSVAREIGLDDAAMRHMYGRRGRQDQQITFANFSVDEEYRQNERDRALGLAEEVKPVRAILPGKHQLRTLLSTAQMQKGALEESFAAGKRNRKEAGTKYGW